MTPVTHSPVPRRKATAAEAAAGIFFVLATAVLAGDSEYESPADQILLHRIVEAVYKSADEGREIRL